LLNNIFYYTIVIWINLFVIILPSFVQLICLQYYTLRKIIVMLLHEININYFEHIPIYVYAKLKYFSKILFINKDYEGKIHLYF